MFSSAKIALSTVIVLSTALAASAATKPQITHDAGSVVYTMIPGYNKDGGVIAVQDPDHYGQPQTAGDENSSSR